MVEQRHMNALECNCMKECANSHDEGSSVMSHLKSRTIYHHRISTGSCHPLARPLPLGRVCHFLSGRKDIARNLSQQGQMMNQEMKKCHSQVYAIIIIVVMSPPLYILVPLLICGGAWA